MSLKEYLELQRYIYENHRFGKPCENSKHIKYIDATTDMRDMTIFSINLKGLGNNEKHFRIDTKEDIQEIYDWLNS